MALPQYADHLLPRNSTALERVLSAAGARLSGLPVDIDLVKRPFAAPSQFLPHLGFELSVDIWENSWLETRKRSVINAAIPLQMKKGTAYCLREYARYVDAEVTKIERPPMGVISGKSLTREDREAWLSSLPQLRIWRIRETSIAPSRKAFLGASSSLRQHGARFCLNWSCPTVSTALARMRRRARWVVDGVETDTRVSLVGTAERLHIATVAGLRVFSGRCFAPGRYLIPSTASSRIVTIQSTQALPWRSAATPSLRAVTSEPERVTVAGTRGESVFCDTPLANFFVPSSAALRIFHRHAVYDGRSAARRAAVQFMGVGRYGWPRHYARASVSIPGTKSRFAAGIGVILPKTKFWLPHNGAALARTRRALNASKRLSDRIDMKIGPVDRFVAGKPFFAGDTFIVGYP